MMDFYVAKVKAIAGDGSALRHLWTQIVRMLLIKTNKTTTPEINPCISFSSVQSCTKLFPQMTLIELPQIIADGNACGIFGTQILLMLLIETDMKAGTKINPYISVSSD